MSVQRGKLTTALLIIQAGFVAFFAIFADYDNTAHILKTQDPNNTNIGKVTPLELYPCKLFCIFTLIFIYFILLIHYFWIHFVSLFFRCSKLENSSLDVIRKILHML